jgi:hypothetical protein
MRQSIQQPYFSRSFFIGLFLQAASFPSGRNSVPLALHHLRLRVLCTLSHFLSWHKKNLMLRSCGINPIVSFPLALHSAMQFMPHCSMRLSLPFGAARRLSSPVV